MDRFYNLWLLLTQCLKSVSLETESETGFECIIGWESTLRRKTMEEAG